MPDAVWSIVVAAGGGSRFGGPKQFELLDDRSVLEWAVEAARSVSDGIVVVLPPGWSGGPDLPGVCAVGGGATRSESVRNGLACVPDGAGIVVVHDAARPFAGVGLFQAVVEAVRRGADGAVPGVPVTDTIKVVSDRGQVVATPDRQHLVAVQTPQAFGASILRRAHAGEPDATDDAALVEAVGGHVVVVPGDPENRKLTVPADLAWARTRVETGAAAGEP